MRSDGEIFSLLAVNLLRSILPLLQFVETRDVYPFLKKGPPARLPARLDLRQKLLKNQEETRKTETDDDRPANPKFQSAVSMSCWMCDAMAETDSPHRGTPIEEP